MAMAGQRENDEVERDIAEAEKVIFQLRPSHTIVHMWRDLSTVLNSLHQIEFYLGYLPEKPRDGVDHEALQVQLQDARAAIGQLALTLSDQAENA
ncbi:hypothetical protein [Microbacterium maritypicum]